jgi:hypothetical protein
MAMKRPASKANPVTTKCREIANTIYDCEVSEAVQEMLAGTTSNTLAVLKASRSPLNERFVVMIGELFEAHKAKLSQDIVDKEATITGLTPQQTEREAALEAAKSTLTQKAEALDKATQDVKEGKAAVKEATALVKAKEGEEVEGNKEVEAVEAKLAYLKKAEAESLSPVLTTEPEAEDKTRMIKEIVEVSKSFDFDKSLMEATLKVLEKAKDERGEGFDETCITQLKDSFTSNLALLDAKVAEGAPGKETRAKAVADAVEAKAACEKKQEELEEAAKTAKAEKEEAAKGVTAAKASLAEFVPELKAAGDALDAAKVALTKFTAVLESYTLLKDLTEETFKEPEPKVPYYEVVDGQKCDREIIDACRDAVAGQGDGRVSMDDAKTVFAAVADGNKETRIERWTLRYCFTAFKWTDAAYDWIIEELKKVPQEDLTKSPKKAKTEATDYYETIDGVKCKRDIVNACRDAIVGQGDGRVSVEDAEKVWAKAADGPGVTDIEKWTIRYCLGQFNFTRAAQDLLSEKLVSA